MRKFSFCGIFATLFVTTTIILLASCSQDDDCYESDMYTLAEMETRSGGGDPGNGPVTPETHLSTMPITEWYELYFKPDIYIYAGYDVSTGTYPDLSSMDSIERKRLDSIMAVMPIFAGDDSMGIDVGVTMCKQKNVPTVTSFLYSSSEPTFVVSDVFFAPDNTVPLPGRYILRATAYNIDNIPFSAFLPNRIFN